MNQQQNLITMPWRRKTILVAAWSWIILAAFFLPPAYAGTDIELYKSFAGNINFQMTGASLRTGSNSASPCTVTNARSAELTGIPSGANILAAYLYWAGSGSTVDNDVEFQSTPITADRTFTETYATWSNTYDYFSGFADVTHLVNADGTYDFSGLTVDTGTAHCNFRTVLAGWSLIVVYSHSSEDLRVINVYDGFRYFRYNSITLTPSNFQIPSAGCTSTGDCQWGVLTWEGDPNITGSGENLYINNTTTPVTTSANPAGNQFNSTIEVPGSPLDPPGAYTYGVDVDIYSLNNHISGNDTNASTHYESGQDLVLLSAEVFSVLNTPVADLSISKSHTGDFLVGQQETYTISVRNNGPSDHPGPITVTDELPPGLTYAGNTDGDWTCGATGQDVTCAYTGPLAADTTLPDLLLAVDVGAAALPSVTNTAIVLDTIFDNQLTNNSDDDVTTVINPGAVTGTKQLYFYLTDAGAGDANTLQRVVNTTGTMTGWLGPGASYSALLSPMTQAPLTLEAGDIFVSLFLRRDRRPSSTRDVRVTLDYFGSSTGTLGSHSQTILGTTGWHRATFRINLTGPVTLDPGTTLRFTLTNEGGSGERIRASSMQGNPAQIAFDTSTVIDVNSVTVHTDVDYPNGEIKPAYPPDANVRIRAVVSDPFGHDDINRATITILDPGSNPQVTDAAMAEVDPLLPGSAGELKTYEYVYMIPAGADGTWTARVTAHEGTEGTISDSGTVTFEVITPAISIVKTVSTISDPANGDIDPRAIPGATMQYEISVTNTGQMPADEDTVAISDLLPGNVRLVLNNPVAPVAFSAGTSDLLVTYPDDVALSVDGGSNFLTPAEVAARESGGIDNVDPKINFIRITPKGVFPGSSVSVPNPGFTLQFEVRLE